MHYTNTLIHGPDCKRQVWYWTLSTKYK